jgi:hypothetical protein
MAKAKKAKPRHASSAVVSSSEHIRVVPLHYPKPKVSVEELRESRDPDSDLFDGKPRFAPASAHLNYGNGPLISNVQVYTIFWGKLWGTNATSKQLIISLNTFFKDILVSPLIDQLAEYNVPGKTIGHGSLIGTKTISAGAPAASVTDAQVQAQLKKWISGKVVPKNNPNSLYFIYLDPGIVSIMGGGKSCSSFCGYHNNAGNIYYALMPYPSCQGCLGGLQLLDALTGTSSHELCEAITDPIPGTGWYDQTNGEIGDICAWNFKKIGTHNVQLEWSNHYDKCM